ncbi:MAG: hypothetical protein HXY18_05195 [Bryobacteraceae bacterium]|nr:hypothetical protein [Bryobacteraceae bacterium]
MRTTILRPERGLVRREFLGLLGTVPAGAFWQAAPQRLNRAQSYFGLHFDLHPNANDKKLGRDLTVERILNLLDRVKPDYVQYDAKGHPGWLGWVSEVGPSAPGIVNDSLKMWREATARRGVALYIHFSGVWDSQQVERHPEWARRDKDGKTDGRNTSVFGPYVDRVMIPQLKEAASKYDLDGVWVDGECWSVQPDYSEMALKAWRAAGHGDAPKAASDTDWLEWLEFNREQFRRYVRHYLVELKKSHPRFQVASNWLYSTLAPEEPTLPVDFLSGDYLGNASISTARLEARYLAQTGRPWDLMAWAFQQAGTNTVGHVYKTALQLKQEAAVVVAQGGGFQIYSVPSRAGHLEESLIETLAEVASFCRERQAASHQSETAPQVGVVFSKESLYRTQNKLFGGWGRASDPARGWVDALVACQWSVDVLPDWKLEQVAASYPLIVLPDWAEPGEKTIATLAEYLKGGGKLIAAGAANAARFASIGGYGTAGAAGERPVFLKGKQLVNAKGLWQPVRAGSAQVLAEGFADHDTTRDGFPAALRSGNLIVIPGPVGAVYAATHAAGLRDIVKGLAGVLFKPMVEVDAPPTVEVVIRKKGGQVRIHLLNATAMQVAGEYATVDYIPAAGPVRLKLAGGGRLVNALTKKPLAKVSGGWSELGQVPLHEIVTVVS